MRRIAFAFLALGCATLVAGCSYTGPARTFQAGSFVCSESAPSIEVNEKFADIALRTLEAPMIVTDGDKERAPTPEEISSWLKQCKEFLD